MGRRRGPSTVALATLAAAGLAACGGGGGEHADPTVPTPPASAAPNRQTTTGRAALAVRPVASGFRAPTGLVREPGTRGRILVLERAGTARWLDGDAPEPGRPFLDLRAVTRDAPEQGLLGLAFLPGDARDRRIVVLRTDVDATTVVSTFRVRDGRADPATGHVVLRVKPPYGNHRGGQIAVDARGDTVLGLGDGGSAYDPRQYAQNRTTLLGKVLRADLDDPRPRWRIAAYGVRSPDQLTFDRATGDLWLADGGEETTEEVDRLSAAELAPGRRSPNLGWAAFEGSRRQANKQLDPYGPLTWPVASYLHRRNCEQVVGGLPLRDAGPTSLRGRYLFGDACTGAVWTVPLAGRGRPMRTESPVVRGQAAWDVDGRGRLLVATRDGRISRIVDAR